MTSEELLLTFLLLAVFGLVCMVGEALWYRRSLRRSREDWLGEGQTRGPR